VNEAVLHAMKSCGYFSIMIDESTDISVKKQLVLYGRTVVEGKLSTRFLKVVDCPGHWASQQLSATSEEDEGISSSLMEIFQFLPCASSRPKANLGGHVSTRIENANRS
jgi:hypothetical protein